MSVIIFPHILNRKQDILTENFRFESKILFKITARYWQVLARVVREVNSAGCSYLNRDTLIFISLA